MIRMFVFWVACAWFIFAGQALGSDERPNVILIVCDDLNDYVEGFGGHPQARTPNIARLATTGVSFTQAHCNVPICGPSRASMFTGIYPHNSGCYGFFPWDGYDVLKNSRTLMDHFRESGYQTVGTGKLMHHMVRQEWADYGNRADYGPWVSDGKNKLAHPDVPAPYRDIGSIDGSFGALVSLQDQKSPDGKPLQWWTGGWGNQRPLKFNSQDDRDPTADEINGQWAVEQIKSFAAEKEPRPFFMGVGFIRPHTPLIVPKKYFEMFPLDSIELPVIRPNDVDDTHSKSIRQIPEGADGPRSEDMGTRLFNRLVESYGSQEKALKHFIQAYLASVASVDDQIGKILDALDNSSLRENTVVILTSDHGWGMGEKNYLYKNSLWQESTRVPLIVRAPGVTQEGGISDRPVSLVDIYPTLIDLCGLSSETVKNEKGRPLDGHSMKPLLLDPQTDRWEGPSSALTALYKWRTRYDPSQESYSLRSKDWRYIRYENGKEELYFTKQDPYEWTNVADVPQHADVLVKFRQELLSRIPVQGSPIPPQPPFVPKNTPSKKAAAKPDPKRDELRGVFEVRGDGTVFVDRSGTTFYLIDGLRDEVKSVLGKEVDLVAKTKPTKSGKGKLIVFIHQIKAASPKTSSESGKKKANKPQRVELNGVFSEKGNGIVFTDAEDKEYFVIKGLREKVTPYWGQPVEVIANVKSRPDGKVQMMVWIMKIAPAGGS